MLQHIACLRTGCQGQATQLTSLSAHALLHFTACPLPLYHFDLKQIWICSCNDITVGTSVQSQLTRAQLNLNVVVWWWQKIELNRIVSWADEQLNLIVVQQNSLHTTTSTFRLVYFNWRKNIRKNKCECRQS